MNMKKTMAAIAAGAVAVSAMATTVSALETRTLHYNLVQSVKTDTKGDADFTVTFTSVALEVGDEVEVTVNGFSGWDGGKDEVTIRPNYNDSTYFAPSFTYTRNKESVKYNSGLPEPTGKDKFEVVENNTALPKNVFVGGNNDAEVANWSIKGASTTLGVDIVNQGKLNLATAEVDGSITLYYITTADFDTAIDALPGTLKSDADTLALNTATDLAAGAGWYLESATDIVNKAAAVVATKTNTNAAGLKTAFETEIAKYTKNLVNDYGVLPVTAPGNATASAPASGDTIVLANGKPALATIYVDVLKKDYVAANKGNDFKDVAADLGGALSVSIEITNAKTGKKVTLDKSASVLNSWNGAKSVNKFPYKSSLNNTIYSATGGAAGGAHGGDVLEHIYTVKEDDDSTKVNSWSVKSVINDAIQQHNGNVTFVFNTATKRVIVSDDHTWDAPIGAYSHFDWTGTDMYMSFGNHYYNNLQYGYDANLDYYVNNWKPDNLFNGLLLVNSNLTLSLSDTEKFDWTEKSLSFTWEDIEEAALTKNQYANYIQNMVLRTSQDWYWDSLDVVLADVETPGLGLGAPDEGNKDEIPDEPEESELPDEPEDPELPDPEPEPEPEPQPEPVKVVNNPTTGNASVALAVIPVALAAAAIVAKKRG